MCRKKHCDALSVCVSILVGVAFALLFLFNLLTTTLITPLLGLSLSALSLLVLVIALSSVLQQSSLYNECMCRNARQLLIGAIWLLIVSAFALVFTLASTAIFVILNFLMFGLMSYTLFSLYCWIKCMAAVGCGHEPC
ncbi:MAG: hypothetical protein PHI98_02065 [Eubacteriales bacterium]|nr:hypothetical protein [Eubacteriales bacterium]